MQCLFCQKETPNPKFCSRTCAVTHNNKIPKRKKKEYFCCKCGVLTTSRRYYCDACNPMVVDWTKVTYKDIVDKRNYQKNSRIRELARTLYNKSNPIRKCFICDYSNHTEICHIKAISSFSDETPISEINDIKNLIALCPNHHWELDNNLISLPSNISGLGETCTLTPN